jgi:hypothetical protein
MSKFTYNERNLIKNTVALLTLKKIPDKEIINEVQKLTGLSCPACPQPTLILIP